MLGCINLILKLRLTVTHGRVISLAPLDHFEDMHNKEDHLRHAVAQIHTAYSFFLLHCLRGSRMQNTSNCGPGDKRKVLSSVTVGRHLYSSLLCLPLNLMNFILGRTVFQSSCLQLWSVNFFHTWRFHCHKFCLVPPTHVFTVPSITSAFPEITMFSLCVSGFIAAKFLPSKKEESVLPVLSKMVQLPLLFALILGCIYKPLPD